MAKDRFEVKKPHVSGQDHDVDELIDPFQDDLPAMEFTNGIEFCATPPLPKGSSLSEFNPRPIRSFPIDSDRLFESASSPANFNEVPPRNTHVATVPEPSSGLLAIVMWFSTWWYMVRKR